MGGLSSPQDLSRRISLGGLGRIANRIPGLDWANRIVDKKIARRGRPSAGARTPLPGACRRFLAGYSDYRDGRLNPEDRSFFVDHVARCASCRRYDRVISKGVRVLRETVPAPVGASMTMAEVRVRATAAERDSLALGTAGSGVTLSAAVVVALLVAVVAWSPIFSGTTPEVAAVASPPASAPTFAPLEIRIAPPGRSARDGWDGGGSTYDEREARPVEEPEANPVPD